MRVINKQRQTITEYDLTVGYLYPTKAIREDAKPIDNKTKFVWEIEDYEEVQMYIPYTVKTIQQQISDLKNQLSSTDYKIIKCSECQLVGEPMPYNVIELHTERQFIRDLINELEESL